MSEITIPFNRWSIDKLEREIKTGTSRTRKYGKPGDIFCVDIDEGVYVYEITDIRRKSLECIAQYHYMEEGCGSPEEFKEVWCDIYPNGWRAKQLVWFHEFELWHRMRRSDNGIE